MSESGVIPRPEERSAYVREVDTVTDMDEVPVVVGVDHDAVTIGAPDVLWRFSQVEAEEFSRAWNAACWEAGENRAHMEVEATMPP